MICPIEIISKILEYYASIDNIGNALTLNKTITTYFSKYYIKNFLMNKKALYRIIKCGYSIGNIVQILKPQSDTPNCIFRFNHDSTDLDGQWYPKDRKEEFGDDCVTVDMRFLTVLIEDEFKFVSMRGTFNEEGFTFMDEKDEKKIICDYQYIINHDISNELNLHSEPLPDFYSNPWEDCIILDRFLSHISDFCYSDVLRVMSEYFVSK